MDVHALSSRPWNTASATERERGAANEMSLLSAHYLRCNGCKGRLFSIRCAIDALDAFVATRLVTTVVVVSAVIGACSLAL